MRLLVLAACAAQVACGAGSRDAPPPAGNPATGSRKLQSGAIAETVRSRHRAGELYDLVNDPLEMDNRFDDPGCAAVRKELEAVRFVPLGGGAGASAAAADLGRARQLVAGRGVGAIAMRGGAGAARTARPRARSGQRPVSR